MGSLPREKESTHSEIFLSLGLTEPAKRVFEFPWVLTLLSSVLGRIVHKNERILGSKEEVFTVFDGLRAPNISIQSYIERIFKYSNCSPSCFVLAYIYMDRFLQRPNAHLTSLNVHRLLIVATAVAAKFADDAFFNNAYYARIGGITTAEMNKLELNFLFSLDFRLQVTVEAFKKYCCQLEMAAAVFPIERPICKVNELTNIVSELTNIEETNHQQSLRRCS
ncbi:Cyclin-P3-1 [Platanthera zijinensis]|uniref:Cyclin n=1 Tax=Platanthera zijinensis TaxID=2320716 RepID=A0AAP0B5H0_9ASPA